MRLPIAMESHLFAPARAINSFNPFRSSAPGTISVPTMKPGMPEMPTNAAFAPCFQERPHYRLCVGGPPCRNGACGIPGVGFIAMAEQPSRFPMASLLVPGYLPLHMMPLRESTLAWRASWRRKSHRAEIVGIDSGFLFAATHALDLIVWPVITCIDRSGKESAGGAHQHEDASAVQANDLA